jgi:AcrR family transcriptional regulator
MPHNRRATTVDAGAQGGEGGAAKRPTSGVRPAASASPRTSSKTLLEDKQTRNGTIANVALASSQTDGSRVARRKEQARQRLVRAAAEIIVSKGTEGLRLREIADLADVGFGSFYTHFDSKEELIAAVVKDTVQSLSAPVVAQSAQADDPAEAAAGAHRWFIRLAATDPKTAQLIVNLDRADVMLELAVDQNARQLLKRGMDSGRFRTMDVETTLAFVVGATIAVMRGVLEGRLDSTADIASAEAFLGVLGVDPSSAAEIARRELPLA